MIKIKKILNEGQKKLKLYKITFDDTGDWGSVKDTVGYQWAYDEDDAKRKYIQLNKINNPPGMYDVWQENDRPDKLIQWYTNDIKLLKKMIKQIQTKK